MCSKYFELFLETLYNRYILFRVNYLVQSIRKKLYIKLSTNFDKKQEITILMNSDFRFWKKRKGSRATLLHVKKRNVNNSFIQLVRVNYYKVDCKIFERNSEVLSLQSVRNIEAIRNFTSCIFIIAVHTYVCI